MSKELETILVTTDTTKLQEKMDEAKYVYDIEAILLEKVTFLCQSRFRFQYHLRYGF